MFLAFWITGGNGAADRSTGFLVGSWLEEKNESRNYVQGFKLNSDGTASSIGTATLQYEKWTIDGNKLVLSGKSIGNGQTINFSDDLQIIEINSHIMKTKRSNGYQVIYYKTSNISDL